MEVVSLLIFLLKDFEKSSFKRLGSSLITLSSSLNTNVGFFFLYIFYLEVFENSKNLWKVELSSDF